MDIHLSTKSEIGPSWPKFKLAFCLKAKARAKTITKEFGHKFTEMSQQGLI